MGDQPTWAIRDCKESDLDAVRALNAANMPEVGPLDEARIELFLRPDVTFWVAEVDGTVVGLFVGIGPGSAYTSPMYRWFVERYDDLAYIDRIAIAAAARGTGLAGALYDRWEELAVARGASALCAEVNVQPPNPRSLAFHKRRGFTQVDELAPYEDDQREAMLVKGLRDD